MISIKESLKDKVKFLFSKKGMPYEKVCLLVAMVVTFALSALLNGNFTKDASVIVIDLDHSMYTRQLINEMNASEYIKVKAVLNTAADPEKLCYSDEAIAVVYFPRGLEEDRYTGTATNIGVFYDNTNASQSVNVRTAINQIISLDNAVTNGDVGSTNDNLQGGVSIAERKLFNPQQSPDNQQVFGFLFFFGSMFFAFATLGMSRKFFSQSKKFLLQQEREQREKEELQTVAMKVSR